jgi:indolepyruvate ferredoxin oxidoreductase alpha subunit
MGNEAIARGAIEAGVRGVFAYPGTPSTEISEVFNHVSDFQLNPAHQKKYLQLTADPIYFEYSVNEKVALEKAIAYSIGNRRALCCMKNVGMNVASDALMTIAYQTIGAALVIVVCDDPGCYSSSNEQDSRHWGEMASVPLFNPATPEDAHKMTKDAFALSEQLKLPVIVRMTTRVDHSRGMVAYDRISSVQQIPKFEGSPQHINIPARAREAHKHLLKKLKGNVIASFHQRDNLTYFFDNKTDQPSSSPSLGVIASGVAAAYALETLHSQQMRAKNLSGRGGYALIKLGLIHPFPSSDVLQFLQKGFRKILILEELDPVIENEVRILAQKSNLKVEIYGKNFAGLSVVGEYNLDIVGKAIAEFAGLPLEQRHGLPVNDIEKYLDKLPSRPPELCPGCPHRSTFYALKLAVPRTNSNIVLCGDIGCFGLGALPPMEMIDTIHHMGMSISMAQGLAEALQVNAAQGKIVALVGDGTLFHSGVASLLNAVYTRANITVVIFDNRVIGMTGHQDNPGAVHHNKYQQIDLQALLKGLGVGFVETIDPFDVKSSVAMLNDAMAYEGVAAVIAKSPCVFLPECKNNIPRRLKIEVDHSRCNTCHNQEDAAIRCSKVLSTENSLLRARAKILAKNNAPATEQLCPANICNHGFFSAILGGDYGEGLNIIRDKILFARVCGDICHRPCEFLYREPGSDGNPIPIKQLKHFVSGIDENFNDFSLPQKRTAAATRKNKSVAIVGAGPAGLSAAYDLIQAGYEVTIYEKENEAGGLLKFAIPGFRMDKIGCDAEIGLLEELGVNFRFDTSLGKDIFVDDLSQDFDAVIIAAGMAISSTIELVEKNVPPGNKSCAISFLRQYNQNTLNISTPATILVIGGGNSAVDAARAAKKYDPKNNVIISCVEPSHEMPAFAEEIEAAMQEDIQIMDSSDVETCAWNSSEKIGVTLKSIGNRKKLWKLHCDYIITAIGQKGDVETIKPAALPTDKEGRIVADSENGHTKHKNVFAAGDICANNHMSVIGAIASGKKAAVGVRQLLEKYAFPYEGQKALDILNSTDTVWQKSAQFQNGDIDESYILQEMPGFNLFQACKMCNHCIENFGCPALLKVNGKVVIDQHQCTRCGLCIDVCINDAIRWVELPAIV